MCADNAQNIVIAVYKIRAQFFCKRVCVRRRKRFGKEFVFLVSVAGAFSDRNYFGVGIIADKTENICVVSARKSPVARYYDKSRSVCFRNSQIRAF